MTPYTIRRSSPWACIELVRGRRIAMPIFSAAPKSTIQDGIPVPNEGSGPSGKAGCIGTPSARVCSVPDQPTTRHRVGSPRATGARVHAVFRVGGVGKIGGGLSGWSSGVGVVGHWEFVGRRTPAIQAERSGPCRLTSSCHAEFCREVSLPACQNLTQYS